MKPRNHSRPLNKLDFNVGPCISDHLLSAIVGSAQFVLTIWHAVGIAACLLKSMAVLVLGPGRTVAA